MAFIIFDNRLENLIIVTCKINNQNKKISKSNLTGTTGVCKKKITKKGIVYE